ncbi:MAG: DNA/RNA non-specific endonuclease [Sphingomonadales bacterium]|nr:DNA/RNA non-specific endonuclease [Sphingomonadales bacterium]
MFAPSRTREGGLIADIEERERRAFLHWLRTGRILPDGDGPAPQWKFNPWHDPADGRFTFRNAGRYFGFGGGGASGTWPAPAKSHPSRPTDKRAAPAKNGAVVAAAVAAATRYHDGGARKVHLRHTYRYETDRLQRTRDINADLELGHASPRSRLAQRQAGGPDRHPGDDGGHYIAHRFNGPSDSFNHFAQNARFNRGRYRALEDKWARALRAGQSVHVHITPHYVGTSQRPASITVVTTIDGNSTFQEFPN